MAELPRRGARPPRRRSKSMDRIRRRRNTRQLQVVTSTIVRGRGGKAPAKGGGSVMASRGDLECVAAESAAFGVLLRRACLLVVAISVGSVGRLWIIILIACILLVGYAGCGVSSSVIASIGSSSRIRPGSCGRGCWLDSSRRRRLCSRRKRFIVRIGHAVCLQLLSVEKLPCMLSQTLGWTQQRCVKSSAEHSNGNVFFGHIATDRYCRSAGARLTPQHACHGAAVRPQSPGRQHQHHVA